MARVRYRRGKRIVWTLRGRHFVLAMVLASALAGGAAWLVWPFWELSGQFGRAPTRQPSRLFAAPLTLTVGEPSSLEAILSALRSAGYREQSGTPRSGEFRREAAGLTIFQRSFPTPRGWTGDHLLTVTLERGRVARLVVGEREVRRLDLEPPILASFYGPDFKERRPVRLDEVPEELVLAILAAEDARFFEHGGISITGILRAAFANLKSRGISQGGSTLTQQLVKNLFLSPERSFSRKAREMVLAVVVDLRYSKREILRAYLNEIYLGASGSVNLMGVGAAAWAYFGKTPSSLTLGESATIAGIIPAPARYSPTGHLEEARARRDLVLRRLGELGWIEEERLVAARDEPLEVSPQAMIIRRSPYFAEAAEREARRRYDLRDLDDNGFVLLSTLSWSAQRIAEEAVQRGLQDLERDWEQPKDDSRPLQAALVALDVATGGIRAYVGGRDFRSSQFDRAGMARRQVGSAFKPVVYAAAFDRRVVTPASLVEDAPLSLTVGGKLWAPRNSDNRYRGWVTVRTAVEKSLNLPTVRVALDTGMKEVVGLAREMGVGTELQAVPAMALGAAEVTPLELATVYATLASGGIRPGPTTLRGALSATGEPLTGSLPSPAKRVLSPEVAYLVTSLLEGVLDRGTGGGARRMGLRDPLAGKTGTTNDRRDSWFAGYSPDTVAVVWVGYDENLPTRLSGSRAALPIWTRYMYATRPAAGYRPSPRPEGIVRAVIDPVSGDLATLGCPQVATEYFLQTNTPASLCHLHGSRRARAYPQPDGVLPEIGRDDPGRFRRWLERIFGDTEDDRRRSTRDDGTQ